MSTLGMLNDRQAFANAVTSPLGSTARAAADAEIDHRWGAGAAGRVFAWFAAQRQDQAQRLCWARRNPDLLAEIAEGHDCSTVTPYPGGLHVCWCGREWRLMSTGTSYYDPREGPDPTASEG